MYLHKEDKELFGDNEDFYKQDYQDNTVRLISDNIDYITVRDFYREFTSDLL